MVSKIMDISDAKRIYNEIFEKLDIVDLDKLCPIEEKKVAEEIKQREKAVEDKLVQAIACGLLYWDNDNNCLTQKLVKPIKTEETSIDILYYKSALKLSMQRLIAEKDMPAIIARLTGHGTVTVGEMQAFDSAIAVLVVTNFFDA